MVLLFETLLAVLFNGEIASARARRVENPTAIRRSNLKSLGSADENIAALVKAQDEMRVARDADADAFADRAPFSDRGAKPQRAGCAEVHTINTLVDAKCGSHAAGAAREIKQADGAAMAAHQFDSFEGLDRAQKHSGAYAGFLAGNIHHERRAVNEINVRVTVLEKKRTIARCLAAEGVAGRVAGEIGFGFNDSPAQTPGGEIANESFANQVACELLGINGQLAALQGPNFAIGHKLFSSPRLCSRRQTIVIAQAL
jgi:hypothetical protein